MFSPTLSRALLAGVDQEEIDWEDRMESLLADAKGMEEITWVLAEDEARPLENALVTLYQARSVGSMWEAAVALRRMIHQTAAKIAAQSVAA